jgi:hypothetical protein
MNQLMLTLDRWAHLPRFEEMPEGWRLDPTWGSPVFGYVPICDGRSILNGGRKGLLKVDIPNRP